MTLCTTVNKKTSAGNGVTTSFPYDFRVDLESDLKAVKYETATETQTMLVLNVDYTVHDVGNDDEDVIDDILTGIGTAPFQAIPIVDDITHASALMIQDERLYKVFNTPVLDDMENAMRKMKKDELNFFDVISILATPVEITTGVPAKTYSRIIERHIK